MYCAQNRLMLPYFNKTLEILNVDNGVDANNAIDFTIDYWRILFNEYTPIVIGEKLVENMKSDNEKKNKNYEFIRILLRLLQNFVSVPIIIHLTSKFTISIAFDSIMWMVVTHFVISDQLKNTMEYMKNSKIFTFKKNNE